MPIMINIAMIFMQRPSFGVRAYESDTRTTFDIPRVAAPFGLIKLQLNVNQSGSH
jgi:hypothetical protein